MYCKTYGNLKIKKENKKKIENKNEIKSRMKCTQLKQELFWIILTICRALDLVKIRDNSSYSSSKPYVVTPHLNRLKEK